jgi:hypothetical protein
MAVGWRKSGVDYFKANKLTSSSAAREFIIGSDLFLSVFLFCLSSSTASILNGPYCILLRGTYFQFVKSDTADMMVFFWIILAFYKHPYPL